MADTLPSAANIHKDGRAATFYLSGCWLHVRSTYSDVMHVDINTSYGADTSYTSRVLAGTRSANKLLLCAFIPLYAMVGRHGSCGLAETTTTR